MKRRRLLGAVCGGLSLQLGGCLEHDGSDGANGSQPSGTTDGPEGCSGEGTHQSDGGMATDAFQDEPCPPYATDADRTVCSHTVDPETASRVLEAAPVRTTLDDGQPSDEITLSLHNLGSAAVEFNPHSWSLWERTATEWQTLEAELHGNGRMTLDPGCSTSWTFVDVVSSVRIDPDLSPGRYAAEISVSGTAYTTLVEFSASE
ncbi:hypothetical protein [Salinarchaeum laminariae]|uniref:hypothetical protein n=1 Tax=Salinarchaeum laminariae TaxID=869888 RepID=UPI0020BEFB21|nr:hypothetical protein [Salinarchaeum laminariae]